MKRDVSSENHSLQKKPPSAAPQEDIKNSKGENSSSLPLWEAYGKEETPAVVSVSSDLPLKDFPDWKCVAVQS